MPSSDYLSFSGQEFYKQDAGVSNHDFKSWAASHMYRTSYKDMTKQVPVQAKKYAIPGYAGYIPGTAADTNLGRRFTMTSKEQLNRGVYLPGRKTEMFPQRPITSTVQGRTLGRFGGGLHDEYHTVSRLHGMATIPKEHPNYSNSHWETSYSTAFIAQEEGRARLFRTTDLREWKNCQESLRPRTQSSGFVMNSTLCDADGWLPMKHLHGDMKVSEYRSRFNPQLKFHPKPGLPNVRKMKKRQFAY